MFDRMSSQFEDLEPALFEGSVAVDLEETEESYRLVADLPGFESDDIDLQVAGDRVTIAAERTEESEESDEDDEGRYVRRERRQHSVSRSLRLPGEVDEQSTEADLTNGVLTVTLPKRGLEADGRNVPIE